MRCMNTLLTAVLLFGFQPLFSATDDFDTDPVDNPEWELYEPVAGSTYSLEDGWWRVTMPAGINLDTWSTVDNAPQLRRTDVGMDFTIETRMRIVGSGLPDDPQWPPVNEAYLANMMIMFGQYDLFHWGPQRGTTLVLQRVGTSHLCTDIDPGLQEVSLQARKSGSEYTFSWRGDDEEPWNLFCTQFVDENVSPPTHVGLIFKSWNPILTMEETFEFDYFTVSDAEEEAPLITAPCDFGETDAAWINMPYVRPLIVSGFPAPDVDITTGPEGLTFDPQTKTLQGWIPNQAGEIDIVVEAENSSGIAKLSWRVSVAPEPEVHDEEFDDDPIDNVDFWELHEPQTGVIYSTVDDGWWRLEVPMLGDLGQNFDTWTAVDRAPQLRHLLEYPEGDFTIETKLRIDDEFPPMPTDPFLIGLLVNFKEFDIIHLHAGFERMVSGEVRNVLMERSGQNNLGTGYYPHLLFGSEIGLRLEKKCDFYNAFWRGEEEEIWRFMGSYSTPDIPMHVGLVMKTFGVGAAFTVDIDFFDILDPGDPLPEERFIRGDVNEDANVNIADAVSLLAHLFAGAPVPSCPDAADGNDDGRLNIADVIAILAHLFGGLGDLPDPFPDCGVDPNAEDPPLPECVYPHCQ